MHWRLEIIKRSLLDKSQKTFSTIRRFLWALKKNKYPTTDDGKTLLHIGCGDISSPEFINIDARKFKHIHIVTRNIFRLWMIPSNTADLIYMCHILEHIPRNNIPAALKEMRRVLKPDGILRISVPDFDSIISIYNSTDHEIEHISPPLMGGQDYPENFHFEIFNKIYLEKLLIKNGYFNITEWNPSEVEYHNFDDWASKRIAVNNKEFPISLNIQGHKPHNGVK
jgi:predicted SAM-dependent methyltransferase